MDIAAIAFLVIVLLLMIPVRMYIQRYLFMRAARTVIGRLREHNAVAEIVARTPQSLGIEVKKPFGRKSYQVMAVNYLVQEDVIRFTPDGKRLYLTERIHEVDPSIRGE
jgi:hypothetical protein